MYECPWGRVSSVAANGTKLLGGRSQCAQFFFSILHDNIRGPWPALNQIFKFFDSGIGIGADCDAFTAVSLTLGTPALSQGSPQQHPGSWLGVYLYCTFNYLSFLGPLQDSLRQRPGFVTWPQPNYLLSAWQAGQRFFATASKVVIYLYCTFN